MSLTESQQAFVDALRSGEYEQGFEMLRTKADTFCCLGVACDVYHKKTGLGEWLLNQYENATFVTATRAAQAFLPMEVTRWLGIEGLGTNIGRHGEGAIELNDNQKLPFTEIADLFEAYFLRINSAENKQEIAEASVQREVEG